MNDKTYNHWSSKSDSVIQKQLGAYIRTHRLEQNKTQQKVAEEAGISRSTLSLLERGETVTMETFIRVLRVLDLLTTLNVFRVERKISPIILAKLERKKRKRARSSKSDEENKEWR